MLQFSGVSTSGFWSRLRVLAALILTLSVTLSMAPLQAYAAESRNLYVVTVKPGTDSSMRKAIAALGETPIDELDFVLDGFTLSLTDADASALLQNPNVLSVTLDEGVSFFASEPVPGLWGLDRIDQLAAPLDGTYSYPDSAGAGVRVYIVDTGVQADNPEFTGRIIPGFDATGSNNASVDCHGHGTHVAGTAAGTSYGVARKATIVPVKVLGCNGSGTMSGIITALDWIVANHPKGTPAVLNMSLGGNRYELLNSALERVTAAGILSVAAAGNNNGDACLVSPASSPSALTVGASDRTDTRAYFSNFGECVDAFAPGTEIMSADAFNPNGTKTWQGTSMAAPHVAGLAALYLSQNPTSSPAAASEAIRRGGIGNQINNALSPTGNVLINNGFTRGQTNPPANTNPIFNSPDTPTGLGVSQVTASSLVASWSVPANNGGSPILGYRLYYRPTGTTSFSFTGASTSATQTLTGLSGGTTYDLKVSAYNAVGASLFSSIVNAKTLPGAPAAPFSVTASAGSSSVSLTWTPPRVDGGSPITGYRVEQFIGSDWQAIATQSATSKVVSGLQANTSYRFRIFAISALGTSPTSLAVTISTLPASNTDVLNLRASNITANSVTLNWDAVSAPAGVNATYFVRVKKFGAVNSMNYNSSSATFSIANLEASTSYTVDVAAQVGAQLGAYSPSITFVMAPVVPSVPLGVRTISAGGVVSLIWNAPAVGNPISKYTVQTIDASGAWSTYVETSATSAVLPTLKPGQLYQYRVLATNVSGTSSPSSVAQIRGPIAVPGQPTALVVGEPVANKRGPTTTLSWLAPANPGDAPVTSYIVKVSRDSKSWSVLGYPTSTSYTTNSPTKGQTWLFKVAAVNAGGAGLESEAASLSVAKTKPAAVSGSASLLAPDQTSVKWYAPADNGGDAIRGYRIENLVDNAWKTIAELGADKTSLQIARTAPGTVQSFRVFATNGLGESETASVFSVSVPALPASAPTNFKVTPLINSTNVELSWGAPVDLGGSAVRYFRIQTSTDGKTWVSRLLTAATLKYQLSQARGTSLKYQVMAVTAAGNGVVTETVTFDSPKVAPTSARSVWIKQLADKSISLNWYAPVEWGGGQQKGYLIQRNVAGTWSDLVKVDGSLVSTTLAALAPGTQLSLRMFAVNEVGQSTAVNIVYTVPFIAASAPQNLTAVANVPAKRVQLNWAAPSDLGGSSVSGYYVYSKAQGATTWMLISAPNATTLQASTPMPAKGATASYMVRARTAFGLGAESAPVVLTAP